MHKRNQRLNVGIRYDPEYKNCRPTGVLNAAEKKGVAAAEREGNAAGQASHQKKYNFGILGGKKNYDIYLVFLV